IGRGVRRYAVKGIACGLYYSSAVRLLKAWGNGWELSTNGDRPWIRRRRSGTVTILVYHRVNDERDPFFPATPIRAFTQQREYVAGQFGVSRLEDAAEAIVQERVPAAAVVVTFDDGYMDNYVNAFPVLKRLGIPATIFLATDAIGTGRVLWHD